MNGLVEAGTCRICGGPVLVPYYDAGRRIVEMEHGDCRRNMDELSAMVAAARQYAPDALQRQCLKTWADGEKMHQRQIFHALLGLAGETGEVCDMLKKHFFKPDRAVNREKVMDELSDVLYYVAVLAHLWEFTFDDMAAHLGKKLADGHGWTAAADEYERTEV